MLTRPPLSLVRDYRASVDERIAAAMVQHGWNQSFRELMKLGINHEQQHQELLLTDVKHLLSLNPLLPRYLDLPPLPAMAPVRSDWAEFAGGVVEIGSPAPSDMEGTFSEGTGDFCFDNELPRHKQYLPPYRLATRLITNAEYLRFIEAGGYQDAQLWLSEGWDWVRSKAIAHPIYWLRNGGEWREFMLSGARRLVPDQPVAHVSFFEADAFARFSGARLPTEGEWEHASAMCGRDGNFLENGNYRPVPARLSGLTQMFGDLWEWTSSSYSPYPGFQAPDGAIGEYNGKFMVNQYVLRGSSCLTPNGHARLSYRNFFPAHARWQMTGIRLARTVRAGESL
jgi:ergothioneine biosynthesis protein EgtB